MSNNVSCRLSSSYSKVNVMPQFVNSFINSSSLNLFGLHNMQSVRLLNRNARRPKRVRKLCFHFTLKGIKR